MILMCVCVCVCVCVFIKLHITTQSGVFIKLHITTQSGPVILVILCHVTGVCVCVCCHPNYFGREACRRHTGFLIHLPSAVHVLIFLARRIQSFLSLVDRFGSLVPRQPAHLHTQKAESGGAYLRDIPPEFRTYRHQISYTCTSCLMCLHT